MIWNWLLPWKAKRLLALKDAELAALAKTIQDIQTANIAENEKLKARLEDSREQVRRHRRALANTAFWIRTTHRVDATPVEGTIREMMMEQP